MGKRGSDGAGGAAGATFLAVRRGVGLGSSWAWGALFGAGVDATFAIAGACAAFVVPAARLVKRAGLAIDGLAKGFLALACVTLAFLAGAGFDFDLEIALVAGLAEALGLGAFAFAPGLEGAFERDWLFALDVATDFLLTFLAMGLAPIVASSTVWRDRRECGVRMICR